MKEFYWSYQQTEFRGINWIPEKFDKVMAIVHGIDHYGHGKTLLIHGNADEFTAVEGSRQFAASAPIGLLTFKE